MTFIKNNGYGIFIVILCLGFAIIGVGKYETKQAEVTTITITEGDTLWGLAFHHSKNMSSEKWIKEVMTLNNLSSATIKKGEELLLPTIQTHKDDSVQLAGGTDD